MHIRFTITTSKSLTRVTYVCVCWTFVEKKRNRIENLSDDDDFMIQNNLLDKALNLEHLIPIEYNQHLG